MRRCRGGGAAAVAVALLSPCTTVRGQNAVTIDSFIRRQARNEHGEEYKDARKVVVGDLNGDGIPDTVVLYTIEGQNLSNNYVQYLAVFVRSKTGLEAITHATVGGKGFRSVELKAVHDKRIDIATMSYAPDDPMCCPSRKGLTHFVLAGRVLKEEANDQDGVRP